MQTNENKRFTIYFQGQCAPGFTQADVRSGFVKLFGVTPSEVDPIFSGEAVFLSTDLPPLALEKYRTALGEVGAEYRYWEQTDDGPDADAPSIATTGSATPASGQTTCPKCGHTQPHRAECVACGVIFEKYRLAQDRREAQQPEPATVDTEQDFQGTTYHPDARRAKRSIQIGSTLLVVVFLIDEIFQIRGLDIGYWPYILSNLCFLHGGWYFAKQRGYGFPLRILGLFNLIGIAVIYLLPDKNTGTRPKGSILKSSLAAVLAIVIGVHWLYQNYRSREAFKELLTFTETVGRREGGYPSEKLIEDTDAFHHQQESMHNYVDLTLMTMSELSFRPNEVKEIGDRLFAALSDYFVWLNYQQYLYAQAYEAPPEHMTSNALSRLKRSFKELILSYTGEGSELGGNARFMRVFKGWTLNCHAWDIVLGQCIELGTDRSNRLNDYLYKLNQHFRDRHLLEMSAYRSGSPPSDAPLPDYPRGVFSAVEMRSETVCELRLTHDKNDGLSERVVVLAVYKQPYKRYGKLHHAFEIAYIGGDLPQKYLQGDFSVYHDWIGE